MSDKSTLPTLAELNEGATKEGSDLKRLLNQEPPQKWIKESEVIEGYRYLPIDKTEYLLREVFEDHKIEILGQGIVFNSVFMTVRVHVLVDGVWKFYDGVGSFEFNTKSPGVVATALPIAKALGIKNACRHFGKLFGASLNREDTMEVAPENRVMNVLSKEAERLLQMIEDCTKKQDLISLSHHVKEMDLKEITEAYQLKFKSL